MTLDEIPESKALKAMKAASRIAAENGEFFRFCTETPILARILL